MTRDMDDPLVALEKKRDIAHGSWKWLTKKRNELHEKIAQLEAEIEEAWEKVVEADSQIAAAQDRGGGEVIQLDQCRNKAGQ